MARNDKRGELPTLPQEWGLVQEGLQVAVRMAQIAEQAVRDLLPAVMHMRQLSDPRLSPTLTQRQSDVFRFLQTQFRLPANPDYQDVANVADAFQRIHRRLASLNRNMFRMVTAAVANAESNREGGDTFGYVDPSQPNVIFLNEMYFSLGSGRAMHTPAPPPRSVQRQPPRLGSSTPPRGVVTSPLDEMHILHPTPFRAGVILHEAVHLAYGADGAVHRAVRGGTAVREGGGSDAFPEIRSYMQAIGDAYVYERFAKAVYALRQ